jgi:hypothetical protein
MKTSVIIKSLLTALLPLALLLVFSSFSNGGSQPVFPLQNPQIFLTSAVHFDAVEETITLPLFKGVLPNGETTWYIITDASDLDAAERLGVNWSPKLANALGTAAVQSVVVSGDLVQFKGTVDFAPVSVLVPGATVFPPATAVPGSTGDADYSPLLTKGDGVVFNAPQVANGTGLHEKVVSISFEKMLVTLRLTPGLYHGKGILYLATDASDPVAATLEGSTFAPNMDAAPGLASNDPKTSARAAIVPIVNGQTGVGNPDRQGLVSAILGEGSPLNVTEIHPRNRGEIPIYSPLWDVHPAVWTDAAIAAGERVLVEHHAEFSRLVTDGLLVSGGSGPANPELGGLKAAGFIVNCPVMALE